MIKDFFHRIFTFERLVWAALLIIAAEGCLFYFKTARAYGDRYADSVRNNKAYAAQLDGEKARSEMFRTTVEELERNNDSISRKLVEAKQKLGVKDREVRQLQYLVSEFSNTDTVFLSDTVFASPEFRLDTVVGDKWVSTRVVLEYPNIVGVETEAVSEKSVVAYAKRETVDPPKKFFLCRWFQKKHTVVKVVVDERNPHITNQENVFIEVAK